MRRSFGAVPRFRFGALGCLAMATHLLASCAAAAHGPVPSIPVPLMAPPPDPKGWTHNWDCIMCETNSMLSANFGSSESQFFNFSDPWWLKTVAAYAHEKER